jgi:hypothetical protein
MMPRDSGRRFALTFGAESQLNHTGGTHASLADGRVRFLSSGLSDTQRRALITISGNDSAGQW